MPRSLTEIQALCDAATLQTAGETEPQCVARVRANMELLDAAREELPKLVGVLKVVKAELDSYCPKWGRYDQCLTNTRYNDCTFCPMRDIAKALVDAGITP